MHTWCSFNMSYRTLFQVPRGANRSPLQASVSTGISNYRKMEFCENPLCGSKAEMGGHHTAHLQEGKKKASNRASECGEVKSTALRNTHDGVPPSPAPRRTNRDQKRFSLPQRKAQVMNRPTVITAKCGFPHWYDGRRPCGRLPRKTAIVRDAAQ
jgi:hypothetical protein